MMIRTVVILLVLYSFTSRLFAQTANRFDILIDELFPDPTPVIGLPGSEFIELINVSASPINLRGWKISDGNGYSAINTDFIIQPDSFVIICGSSAVASFSLWASAIGISNFPSLNNDADILSLYSPDGRLIHSIGYNNSWYRNDLKKEGGWTLEMIDCKNPCGGADNWKASTATEGGTPGTINSVNGMNSDNQLPALLRTYAFDSVTIVLVFDEALDSISATTVANYNIDQNIGAPISAIPVSPLFTEVTLRLHKSLQRGIVYQVSVNNVVDCAGNYLGKMNTGKTGLPVIADTMDIVINELLFNPAGDGYDYVEFYNRSKWVIDCRQLIVASRTVTGAIANIVPFSNQPWLLFPGEYLVLTENKNWLQQNFVIREWDKLFQVADLPSLPDDKGTIVLLNYQGKVIDELTYDQQWHFPLIRNKEGVALERIDYSRPTQLKTNWTSAASTSGFGTPGYQNSQFRSDLQLKGELTINPKIFSPDNDGFDDFAIINYQLTEPGYTANISIFDLSGRKVRVLAGNATLSASGVFRWDGLDDRQQKLGIGCYIIVTEIFNLAGKTKKFKNVVTLAARL